MDVLNVPLTPLDFLQRARRLFPDRVGVDRRRRSGSTYARVRGSDATGSAWALDARPRRAARRPRRVAVRQHARAARGVLRRAARRRGAAAAEHPARDRRDAVRARRQRRRRAVPASRPTRPRARRAPGRRWATSTRRCSPRSRTRRSRAATSTRTRRPSSSTRRDRPGSPKGALLSHRGLYLHAVHNALTGGLVGRRRRDPHHPALPRERLGHAALRDRARRRARDAAAASTPARCCA